MNEKAIKKLRRKFTILALLSFVAVMLFMSITIYITNVVTTSRQVENTLNFLTSDSRIAQDALGGLMTMDEAQPAEDIPEENSGFMDGIFGALRDMFNTNAKSRSEVMYSLRYFTVIYLNDEPIEVLHLNEMDESEVKAKRSGSRNMSERKRETRKAERWGITPIKSKQRGIPPRWCS